MSVELCEILFLRFLRYERGIYFAGGLLLFFACGVMCLFVEVVFYPFEG